MSPLMTSAMGSVALASVRLLPSAWVSETTSDSIAMLRWMSEWFRACVKPCDAGQASACGCVRALALHRRRGPATRAARRQGGWRDGRPRVAGNDDRAVQDGRGLEGCDDDGHGDGEDRQQRDGLPYDDLNFPFGELSSQLKVLC